MPLLHLHQHSADSITLLIGVTKQRHIHFSVQIIVHNEVILHVVSPLFLAF